MLLDKAKMVCIKLNKVFVIMPYTVSKIELRMRNIIMNNKNLLEGISHFMSFYIINQQFQTHIMKKYTEFLKQKHEMENQAKRYSTKSPQSPSQVSNQQLLFNIAAVGNNYTTNFSSNMPPVQSGSMG